MDVSVYLGGMPMRLNPTWLFLRLGVGGVLRAFFHLPNFFRLFLALIRDPRVSLISKTVPVGMVAYLLFPADLLPDFLVGLGQIDDLVVILLGLRLFLRLCPREVVQEHVRLIARAR